MNPGQVTLVGNFLVVLEKKEKKRMPQQAPDNA